MYEKIQTKNSNILNSLGDRYSNRVPINVRRKINTIRGLYGDGKIVQFGFAKRRKKTLQQQMRNSEQKD